MRTILRVALPAVLLAAVACQSGADDDDTTRRTEETTMREWSLRVDSSGGITGRGDGSVAIGSEGQVEKTTPNGTVCRGTVEEDLLETLERAIAAARPEGWRGQYFIEGGADFFTYSLTMKIDGIEQRGAEWNDGVNLPADLARLRDAIAAVQGSIDCDQRTEASSSPQ